METFYSDVKRFNNLAGKKNFNISSIVNQYKLIEEEVCEIKAGIENNDIVEILDGVVDTLFVCLGMLQQLEDAGCDVQGAIKQVCTDNTSKFPSDEETAVKTVMYYNNQNVNAKWEYNEKYQRYVIKDENQKIRKPYNFIPTDLTQYVPENLQRKGLE